jgi:hypothetical protein
LCNCSIDWNELGGLFDQFTLNFDSIEDNKNGFLCIRPQSIPVLDERVDGFVVFKCLTDPQLLLDPDNFEAKLLSDSTGMVIKEPAIAPCFVEDIGMMEEAENNYPSGNCDRVFEELRVKIVDNTADKNRKHRYTLIKFPNGMKGTNVYFNQSAGKRKETKLNLDTNPRFVHQHFKGDVEFDYVTTYVYWTVAVDGTQRSTNEKKPKSSLDDLFAEAIRGMKSTSLGK